MKDQVIRKDGSVFVQAYGPLEIMSATYGEGLQLESTHLRIDKDLTHSELVRVVEVISELLKARWEKVGFGDDEWVVHDGSDWPKFANPTDIVHVMFRDGDARSGLSAEYWHDEDIECNNWRHDGDPLDIMYYRVVV